MDFTYSRQCYDRARIIPGRSNTRSKAPGRFFAIDAGPLYAAGAEGALIYDVDGNKFVDMLCALGAISIGYGMLAPLEVSGVYSLPHYAEIEASERILERVAPWASSVRMVRTGSEATTAALLIARKATGRSPVFVASNAYHAWHPWASMPDFAFRYKYGDRDDLARLVSKYGPPSAIVVEPARWEPTPDGYLKFLQDYAASLGALFVVDEMIYGGRVAIGGATGLYGLKPDLATFGKAFGNGSPVAFVVGNEKLIEFGEFVSGTYSGDVSSAFVVDSVVKFYEKNDVVAKMWSIGERLQAGLYRAMIDSAYGGTGYLYREGVPVHQRLRFEKKELGHVFSAEMARRGVLWHPEVVNVCFSHTDDQVDLVCEAAFESLTVMKNRGQR